MTPHAARANRLLFLGAWQAAVHFLSAMPFCSQLHVSDLRCQIRLDASALCLRAEPDRMARTPHSSFPISISLEKVYFHPQSNVESSLFIRRHPCWRWHYRRVSLLSSLRPTSCPGLAMAPRGGEGVLGGWKGTRSKEAPTARGLTRQPVPRRSQGSLAGAVSPRSRESYCPRS